MVRINLVGRPLLYFVSCFASLGVFLVRPNLSSSFISRADVVGWAHSLGTIKVRFVGRRNAPVRDRL